MDIIEKTVKEGLCISCGVCAGNCPKNCIQLKRDGKMYHPVIDQTRCVGCGICDRVCPVNRLAGYDGSTELSQFLLGDALKDVLCVKTKDWEILLNSTSGGFVTQMVRCLLDRGAYDSAFLVEGYHYDDELKVKRFTAADKLLKTGKSRYLTVSHEDTIRHMIAHPDEKLIIVATGCCMDGLINTIAQRHLRREQYLLLGLFCDKTMHQGAVEYFAQHPAGKGRKMDSLYFRTKENGGWPGNVRIGYTDGSTEDLPASERKKIKEYFMPKRCLYCMNKLNIRSDISVGDNYIAENKDQEGANSILIRTDIGERAWNLCREAFVYKKDDVSLFAQSQHLEKKTRNYKNACMAGLYGDKTELPDKSYQNALNKLDIGSSEPVYQNVSKNIKKETRKRWLGKLLPKRIS